MEYFLCRAMEIGRLTTDQIWLLQEREKKCCWMPYQIQDFFKLPVLKEHYQIPTDDLTAEANHNQRLRSEFRKSGIYPKYGDIHEGDPEEAHLFDDQVLEALKLNKINLFYMGSISKYKKHIESL